MLSRLSRVIALLKNPSVSGWPKALVLLAVLYLLMPADLVPDIPIVGWIDDLLVLWLALSNLLQSGRPETSAPAAAASGPSRSEPPLRGPIIDVTPVGQDATAKSDHGR
jgi:uncharacterized membrane protein YkvA (DUF1232 family)